MSLNPFERRVPAHSNALHDCDHMTVEEYERGAWGPMVSVRVISGEETWRDPKSEVSKPC